MHSVTALPTPWAAWPLLALLAIVCLPPAEAGGSRYDRTIRALQQAEAEWRSDFAAIALWQLASAYHAEAELARQDAQQRPEPGAMSVSAGQKSRHWSASVEQYAGRLSRFQRRVEEGAAVSFDLSPVTEAVLNVDGTQVMLAHPRPYQQAVFEQTVLEQFCQLRDCGALTGLQQAARDHRLAAAEDTATAAVTAVRARASLSAAVKPGWEFSANGPVCTYGGIRLGFPPDTDPGAVRNLCLDLFSEVAILGDGLRQQQQYGVLMDWTALSFSQAAAGVALLQLNRSGDLLRIETPLLQAHPDLLGSLIPWLAAQLSGEQVALELRADTFGWRGAALDRYR